MYEGLKRRFAFGLGKRDPYVRLIKRSSFDDLLLDLWLGPGSGQSDHFRLTKRGLSAIFAIVPVIHYNVKQQKVMKCTKQIDKHVQSALSE